MADRWDDIAARAVAALTPQERETALVYLDERELPAGSAAPSGDDALRLHWPAALAFVDLEPGLNWAHRCRYLAVRLDGREVEPFEARFPPDLRAQVPTLRLVWTGPRVPAWVARRG